MVYYNEFDPKAAAWLRELIKAGLIAKGEVDERSISDVRGSELAGYSQCHFFAGLGGWSYALRLAGWPDTEPVWTGSCPCQPWSIANTQDGGGKGDRDDRHLLPCFLDLIGERKPPVVFGEQVANAITKGWLDVLIIGLEKEDYSCGVSVFPANAVGAEHERERLYFVADSSSERWQGYQSVERLSLSASSALAVDGNPLIDAGRALDGDYSHLLPCDGVSVQLERDAIKCYGNALVPEAAAEFIKAYVEIRAERDLMVSQGFRLESAAGRKT